MELMSNTSAVAEKGKKSAHDYITGLLTHVVNKNPGEKEFHQAVKEVLETLTPVLEKHPEYIKAKILDRCLICHY